MSIVETFRALQSATPTERNRLALRFAADQRFLETDGEGRTVLMIAAAANDVNVLRAVLSAAYQQSDAASDNFIQDQADDPMAALDRLGVIPADINAVDLEGKTALDMAIDAMAADAQKMLQQYGGLSFSRPRSDRGPLVETTAARSAPTHDEFEVSVFSRRMMWFHYFTATETELEEARTLFSSQHAVFDPDGLDEFEDILALYCGANHHVDPDDPLFNPYPAAAALCRRLFERDSIAHHPVVCNDHLVTVSVNGNVVIDTVEIGSLGWHDGLSSIPYDVQASSSWQEKRDEDEGTDHPALVHGRWASEGLCWVDDWCLEQTALAPLLRGSVGDVPLLVIVENSETLRWMGTAPQYDPKKACFVGNQAVEETVEDFFALGFLYNGREPELTSDEHRGRDITVRIGDDAWPLY